MSHNVRGLLQLAAAFALALALAACAAALRPRPAPEPPDAVEDNRLLPPPGPDFSDAPGQQALRAWASACRERGAQQNPVFDKEGTLVISWVADREGELLQLEFPVDSFRGWEVAPGLTFAECIVQQARQGKLRWSRAGTAPLRLLAVEAARSAPAAPQSQPAAASQPSAAPQERP